MTRKVVSPIALDKSINTTEQTPRNIADVLAQQLEGIKTAIESGNGNLEAAFVCYYGVTTATQIKDAIEDGKVPYFYYNGSVAQLWKVETDKYTFRTTNTRSVEGQTILDVVDYVVNGSVWSTVTREVSGGSSSGQSYIASVNSLADFDTTGKSGMQDLVSVANVPADGVYQVSVMLHITPKTASATKSDLVLQFTSSDNTGWPSHTFHAVVDDSQTFAQQLSFSTSVSLKAGENTLRIQCGGLNTEYLVFVDELTVAQLVNGVYHNDSNIYSTLQDAIANAANLSAGDIFETNGFYTSGDGGASRYVVSDTGTANGMDIVQLADGKLATIQVTQECSPEQIGYATGTDAVPYIVRLIAIGIKKIRLIKNYTWKTTLTLTTRGIDFVGNIPFTQNPVTSLINVNLNQGLTSAIVLRTPNITFENLYFYNAKGSPSDETAVNCDWSSSGANNYMIKFKRVRFVSFNYGVYFHGILPWHITFEDVVLGWCNYGIVFAANSSILSFKNVHTSGCYVCGINMRGATQGVAFTQCNFGSYSNALHFEKYGLGMNQEYTFTGCNFELDKLDLDGNTKNVFIDVDDDINVSLDFSGCNFVITKQAMQVIPANMRFIRLGNGSTLRMTACVIEDDLSGNAYLKQFLDESRTPLQETGSLSIDSTTRYFEVDDALIPYVIRTGQAKGLVAEGARTGSETAISDCDTWIPDYDGEVKVARVSTYEGTQNMPVASSFYGFLWTMGVIHGPNIRVWQMLLGSNGNIYTRLGMDLGSGMTWNVWKTITAT